MKIKLRKYKSIYILRIIELIEELNELVQELKKFKNKDYIEKEIEVPDHESH